MTSTFADLGLRAEILTALEKLGYEQPTPIQGAAIPVLISGSDLLAQAATGTGKTAAFALPILERLPKGDRGTNPTALVLTPTRELAVQVAESLEQYGAAFGARVLAIYGGQPFDKQLRPLKRGVDVVVATPGRALDHIRRKTLRLDDIEMVVLDEADEMLDMGFAEELDQILSSAPQTRQTALFSATMPPHIESIARSHLNNPERISIAREKVAEGEAPRVRQVAYVVSRHHKPAALGRIIDMEAGVAAVVFCRTRGQVDDLTKTLTERNYRAEALHGGMNQEQRDRVMSQIRNKTTDLLVATDVAARGLDIDQLTHVVNYDVPASPESYVHRIGRVGRAGREGVAITLVDPREQRNLKTIERVTKQRIAIEKIPALSALRTRRLAMTQASLEAVLEAPDGLDAYRDLVADLGTRYDPEKVALAAVKLLHEATSPAADEQEIPEIAPQRKTRFDNDSGDRKGGGRGRGQRGPSGPTAKIFLGVGRLAKVRPQDIVGVIANETSLTGRDIGGIDIMAKFSLVEVPESSANDVIADLRRASIRGQKVTVRRDKGHR